MRFPFGPFTCLAVALCLGSGCAAKKADMLHFLRENDYNTSAIEYRVGIPDRLAIHAPRVLEIDNEVQRIQPDGKINLKLLGNVKVVGMTAKEVAAKLQVLLSKYYVDPKVSVRVVGYESKKFYVYGEGMRGGPRPYTGRDTLLDAVMPSVGNYKAWISKIKVIRPARGDTPVRTLEVDVKEMVRQGNWSQNILLEPNDVVYVPPTPLAWFGNKVREVLSGVQPAADAYTMPAYYMNLSDAYDDDGSDSNYVPAPGSYYNGY